MVVSLGAVFLAGVLTFFSPCVLPLVPVYLAILGNRAELSQQRSNFQSLLATLAFVLGFTLVFSLLGLSASALGRFLIKNKLFFQQVGGIIILLLGLRFLGYLHVPLLEGKGQIGFDRFKTKYHYVNAFILGLFFAFAWTPCVGSVLGAVLTYASLSTTDPLEGMGWLSVYSLGFAAPLLVVAAFADRALQALRKLRRFVVVFEKTTGTLLVALGFLLATDKVGLLDSALSREPEEAPPLVGIASEAPLSCDSGSETCLFESAVSKPTVLKFFSPSCPICLQMVPIVAALKNECASKNLDFQEIDVSTPQGKTIARRFGVTGIPVFIFLGADGKEMARLVGYQTLDALERAAAIVIGEQCSGYRQLPELLR